MDEISENIFNEELNKLFLLKIHIRENYIWMNTRWSARSWSEEIQNTHYSSHSVSLNLKDDILLKANQWADQAQRERENTLV